MSSLPVTSLWMHHTTLHDRVAYKVVDLYHNVNLLDNPFLVRFRFSFRPFPLNPLAQRAGQLQHNWYGVIKYCMRACVSYTSAGCTAQAAGVLLVVHSRIHMILHPGSSISGSHWKSALTMVARM